MFLHCPFSVSSTIAFCSLYYMKHSLLLFTDIRQTIASKAFHYFQLSIEFSEIFHYNNLKMMIWDI